MKTPIRALLSESLQPGQLVTISKLWRYHFRWLKAEFLKMFTSFKFSSGQICKESFQQESHTVGKRPFLELIGDLGFAYEHLSVAVAYSCNFLSIVSSRPLFGEHLRASWTFTRVSCLLVSGSVAVWPWNDLQSDFSCSKSVFSFQLMLQWYDLPSVVLRVGVRCDTTESRLDVSLTLDI